MLDYEKETIILFNEEEKTASVYTHNVALIRKLLTYCLKYPDSYKLKSEDKYTKTFIIPKRYVSIRQPITLSVEARQTLIERGKKLGVGNKQVL